MYYRLKEPWAFRGWQKLPFAVCATSGNLKHSEPLLTDKDTFLELLCCNGNEDVDLSTFSERGKDIIGKMLSHGFMDQSESPLPPLSDWQHYTIYPSRYLRSVHWSITGRCNMQCRHCLVSAPDAHHPQLPLEDCLHIVDEIAGCGVTHVDITGGEPLVRRDFEEIVKALNRHSIDIGVLFTNASLLTEETLDMLERLHQRPIFQISFDGLGHHDWLRGVKGAEQQTGEAFRLLKEREYRVDTAMCIHRENRNSLRATVNYLAEMNVRNLRVNSPQYLGRWKQYSEQYALTEDEVWDTYKAYIADYFADGMPIGIELDGYFRCDRGSTDYRIGYVHHAKQDENWSRRPYCDSMRYNLFIGPEGRLAPCMGLSDTALKDKFPSVLEHSLAELTLKGYCHEVTETKVGDLLAKNPACASCEHLPVCCGGCLVAGITEEGNYLVPDERCCYFHKHIGEAAVRATADEAIKLWRCA